MDAKPKIFISTVTKELASAREKVADTLRRLHFTPVIQEEFASHTGIVREMLEKELSPCAAVIQIVGHRYGWDVYGAPDPTEVMSYTHYEALYAHKKPIPIWYLVISDDYEVDADNDEDAGKKMLQSAYRVKVQRTGHLHHTVSDIKDIELTVFRMYPDLDKLRPARCQQIPLLENGDAPSLTSANPPAQPVTSPAELEKMMRAVLSDFIPALQQARQNANPESDAAEEEKLALQATDTTNAATRIAAFRQAGEAAAEQIQYQRALDHYRAAAALTSKEKDVLEWAAIQNEIGRLFSLSGQYEAQATLMHRVWRACEKAGHHEHPTTLQSHLLGANALNNQGKHEKAEQEYRAILPIMERVLGPEHPDTLGSRNNLAIALNSQGKDAQAEQEYRAVLAIMERVRGPEYPDTLASLNNLANALYSQGKHTEAEQEHRAVLAIRERVLGPEHPDTLGSRNNLANTLDSQGRHAEAEQEYRTVLAIRKRVLGPEHPHVFQSCYNLSLCLEDQGKKPEALEFARRALAGRTKILGEQHPDTLDAKRQVEDLEQV